MAEHDRSAIDDRIGRHQQLRDKLNRRAVRPDDRNDRPLGSPDGESNTVVLDEIEPDTLVLPRPALSAKPLIAPPPITLPVPPPQFTPGQPNHRRRALLAIAVTVVLAALAIAALLLGGGGSR